MLNFISRMFLESLLIHSPTTKHRPTPVDCAVSALFILNKSRKTHALEQSNSEEETADRECNFGASFFPKMVARNSGKDTANSGDVVQQYTTETSPLLQSSSSSSNHVIASNIEDDEVGNDDRSSQCGTNGH